MSAPIQNTIPMSHEGAGAEAAQPGTGPARGEGAALESLFDALLAAFGTEPSAEELAALAEEAGFEDDTPEEESDLAQALDGLVAGETEEGEPGPPLEAALPPAVPFTAQPEQTPAAPQDARTERAEPGQATPERGAPREATGAPSLQQTETLSDVAAPPGPAAPSEGAAERSAGAREAAAAASAETAREHATGGDRPGHETGQERAAAQARDARALEPPRANASAPFPEMAPANDPIAASAPHPRAAEATGHELRALRELPAANENEIVRSTQVLARDGGGQARIQLVPPQLGQLDLRVTLTENAVQVSISADRGQVAELLARHVPELRQVLQAQGLQVDRLDVDVNERDATGGRLQPGDRGDRDEAEGRGRPSYERERPSARREDHAQSDWRAREPGSVETRGGLSAVDVRV